jgi:hypothetical protein
MGPGTSGKDVEDQLTAIQHLALDDLFQFADLSRREIIVKNNHIGLFIFDPFGEHLGLAGTDIGGGVDAIDLLNEPVHNDRSSTLSQRRQFTQNIVTICFTFSPQNRSNQYGTLLLDL